MALRLIIEDEEGATTIVPLGEEEITVGREPGNTIQLTEQNVSRQHARLTPGSEGWVIEDLDSYNGVRVNGVRIEGSVTLHEGDVVQIGDYHLAITNNAEQTTLALNHSGGASTLESTPMTTSSKLPQVPAAEAAALSGSSGSATSASKTHDAEVAKGTSSEGKGRGLLLAVLLLLLLGGGFAAYKLVDSGTPGVESVRKNDPSKTGPKVPEPKTPPGPAPVEPPPTKPPPSEPPPSEPPPGEPPTELPPGEPPPSDPLPLDPTGSSGSAGDEAGKKATPKVEKAEKAEKTEKAEKKPPVEVQPKPPKGDPVQLLEEARKANFAGNATQAYDLAKKSYDIDRNINALALMGATACKMGDQTKAKAAFQKISDPSRQKQMVNVCAERGIMLE